jgi:DNA-binding Lrp family transcriptional regulator
VAKGKDKSRGRLSVFKGREARLNRAIFHILAHRGPQTIYDIHKEIRVRKGFRYTRYASTNKRVRSLEDQGYIRKVGVKETKAGFQASLYELTSKAYLVTMLSSVNLENLVKRVDDSNAQVLLASLSDVFGH